ncbi:hypothetical protein [Sulfuricaulis sp.]|jgi:ribosomal 50S subunit-associated protein YjgA (DUF615 family)|uniref:hypothetical protein n=1 Tax=Sulfuricaulis sp. TaxID=2003553 RepID=UPI00355AA484
MATANLDLPNGTKVRIEGTPEEINRIIQYYGHSGNKKESEPMRPAVRQSHGAMQHLRELIHENFFKEKRLLSDVQAKLEELGCIYPQTHISTPLRRLVRKKELRRIRESKNWVYVNS